MTTTSIPYTLKMLMHHPSGDAEVGKLDIGAGVVIETTSIDSLFREMLVDAERLFATGAVTPFSGSQVIANGQLIEIASWRVAVEFVRRAPDRLVVTENHACDSKCDALTVLVSDNGAASKRLVDLSRTVGPHFGAIFYGPSGEPTKFWHAWPWTGMLQLEDPKAVVDDVARDAGLSPLTNVPASTPRSLTYRLCAAFLTHAVLGRNRWECRAGLPFGPIGVRKSWFTSFPDAQARLDVSTSQDLGHAASRFWFLVREGVPEVCLEVTGTAWDRQGHQYDVLKLYRANGRRLWPTIMAIAGHLLP